MGIGTSVRGESRKERDGNWIIGNGGNSWMEIGVERRDVGTESIRREGGREGRGDLLGRYAEEGDYGN